jgi:hypothetical protein
VLPLVPYPSEQLDLLALLGFEDLGDRLHHPEVLRSAHVLIVMDEIKPEQ